jgi:hypothetical protein
MTKRNLKVWLKRLMFLLVLAAFSRGVLIWLVQQMPQFLLYYKKAEEVEIINGR